MKVSLFNKNRVDLLNGSVAKGMVGFAMPMFLGQLLQQLYSLTDAWVIGHFADNDSFAAISTSGSLSFLIVGFFMGLSAGGGVVISRYFGSKDEEGVIKAIHTNFLLGLIASVLATAVGLIFAPQILKLMSVPDSVMTKSLMYFRISFGGVSTVIMFNICMSIMRSLGDSIHPMFYLMISTGINVVLDFVLVAGLNMGVMGAASATVFAQGTSAILCIIRMSRAEDYTRLDFKRLRLYPSFMREVIRQGLPNGVQNSVISIGNIVVQKNINSFGSFAMSGVGAYSKIEGLVFLPITSMSMTIPTFVSQNLGAGNVKRAKKGVSFGIFSGMILAEIFGLFLYLLTPQLIGIFTDEPEAIAFGVMHAQTISLFFFLLSFSHCAAGALRGCGKSYIPMITMLAFWCGVRVLYVTTMIQKFPVLRTISWAYPLTWSLSSVLFLICLLTTNWENAWKHK